MSDGDKKDPGSALFESPSGDLPEAAPAGTAQPSKPALVCLSHLRWDFVYQRPQHLMSRFARERTVLFVEEPVAGARPELALRTTPEGVLVVQPRLPEALGGEARDAVQAALLDALLAERGIRDFVLWYYTPMSLAFSAHWQPRAIVYDCMDELSAFRGAPREMLERERQLLDRAHLVFTGGRSLYEAKRGRHAAVHEFPSAVDVAHFAAARAPLAEPADQAALPRPRLGFFGVLDERFDLALLDAIARARPQWSFVLIGPVAKIHPDELPRHANVHALGLRRYAELPAYLAGWDVALMPFARNEATRFISPTKTPEYLAAGKPVVSTAIADVVAAYGECPIVRIADTPEAFIAAIEAALHDGEHRQEVLRAADAALANQSWEATWQAMDALVCGVGA